MKRFLIVSQFGEYGVQPCDGDIEKVKAIIPEKYKKKGFKIVSDRNFSVPSFFVKVIQSSDRIVLMDETDIRIIRLTPLTFNVLKNDLKTKDGSTYDIVKNRIK